MLNPEIFCTVLVYFPTNGLVLQTNVMTTLCALISGSHTELY